jgi:hypothetical protein
VWTSAAPTSRRSSAGPPRVHWPPAVRPYGVALHAADLVEPAKVAALEDLNDGYRALAITTSWLRGKLAG